MDISLFHLYSLWKIDGFLLGPSLRLELCLSSNVDESKSLV